MGHSKHMELMILKINNGINFSLALKIISLTTTREINITRNKSISLMSTAMIQFLRLITHGKLFRISSHAFKNKGLFLIFLLMVLLLPMKMDSRFESPPITLLSTMQTSKLLIRVLSFPKTIQEQTSNSPYMQLHVTIPFFPIMKTIRPLKIPAKTPVMMRQPATNSSESMRFIWNNNFRQGKT